MVKAIPYLSVSSALDALSLYKDIFNAELVNRMPVDESQAEYFGLSEDADLSKYTMHSEFKIGDAMLYMSDNFSDNPPNKSNVSVLINPDSLEQLKEFYNNAEEQDCEITMELEQQFWGDWFCSFVDEFGITWQMNFSPSEDK